MRLVIALLSVAVLAAAPQQNPKQEMRVACTVPPDLAKGVKMRIDGIAPFKDGTKIRMSVMAMTESSEGRSIVTTPGRALQTPKPFTIVKNFRFSYEHIGVGPGRYKIILCPQGIALDKYTVRHIEAWDDKLIETLRKDLERGERLARESFKWVEKCEKAASSKSSWRSSGKSTLEGLNKLVTVIDRSYEVTALKAGYDGVSAVMFKLHDDARVFQWDESGKLVPEDYYEKRLSPLDNEWNFRDFKVCLEDANNVLGREVALWFMKDFKRRKDLGKLSTGSQRAVFYGHIKKFERHPVTGKFMERLLKLHELKPEILVALEKDIRG
jgi:hypothetical protein